MASERREVDLLLLHDGELEDVRAVLREMGLAHSEWRGAPGPDHLQAEWDLVLATPHRLMELEQKRGGLAGIGVAFLGGESRTLRTALRRSGVHYMVRRPFHREALRLLLLHALYRGPEKRRQRRVSIGAPVRVRVGWRRGSGVLTELSTTGCRVLTDFRLPYARRLSLQLPADIAGGRGLGLRGRLVRHAGAESGDPRSRSYGIAFESLSASTRGRLEEIVKRFREGPAVFEGQEPAEGPAPERRNSHRHELARHIIALGDQGSSVLLGRDVSTGGMRVDPHPGLAVGDELRLALHVRARQEPLVVRARVTRDEGPSGSVLEFHDLSEPERDYLERMVDFLPILARGETQEEAGVIFSQILPQE